MLGQYQTGLQDVERVRADAYGSLRAQIAALAEDQHRLRSETQKLTHALRSGPKTRGRWGEQQLRNVLEMAGLSEHVDFRAEVHVATDDGRLRPDAVVRLPGGRQLVIDAKTSLNAYQEALDTQDDAARHTHMRAHAEAMRLHVEQLGGKTTGRSSRIRPISW
nr:DNA recombination protein RmuC [Hankyongella ginsenosidimutans]